MTRMPAMAAGSAAGRSTPMHWRDRWLAWRDARLASPAFQRWAARFAPTRPIARRRSRQLFDLVAGFVYSQVLLAGVRLQLFDRLAAGPQPLRALAAAMQLDAEAARRLLDAAAALRLVERRGDDVYGLGPIGAPLAGNEALAAMIEHHSALYADLADPVALLRGERRDTALGGFWPYARDPAAADADGVAAYSRLMSASLPLVADAVFDAYSIASHRRLLDVGGGEGEFVARAARVAPGIELMLFDLPAVAARAHSRFAALGLLARARAIGGDFHVDELPRGADLVTLIRVVHDHDDASALRLLKAVHAALPSGGTLLLAEPMARTRGAEAMGDAYFGWYLLAMGRGRPRSRAELTAMLNAAGFARVRPLPSALPLQTGLLLAVA